MGILWQHKDMRYVSRLRWMPEEFIKDSKPYSDIVCMLMKGFQNPLSEILHRDHLQSSQQLLSDSDTDSENGTSAGDVVSIVTRGRTRREATYALKRPRLEDQSDSDTPPQLEPILPASIVVEITNPLAGTTNTHATTELSAENYDSMSANSTRKIQKTRDGGKLFELLTSKIYKIANTMIGDNQWDGNAGSDVSTDAPQPEQHNISGRPNTLPDEQVTTFNDGNEGSEVRSRYFTPISVAGSVIPDNHNSPAPQLSRQDGPGHSRSPSLLPPPSPKAINIPATTLISGSREESPLVSSTRQSLPSCKFV
jgi:hypothetical protein